MISTPKPQASAAGGGSGITHTTSDLVEHVYVHIPFCARICPYCAFYKERLDRSQTDRFCQAVLRELELAETEFHGRKLLPSTIYFGGGTPTALTTSQLELLLDGFRRILDTSRLTEWTVEANPGSVSPRKAEVLNKYGVNRISLGVQSWENELLKVLGREHNASQAEESFRILRTAGFLNINIDLMFGLPHQTAAQWDATLRKTVMLAPEHISAYCLTYEEDTEFFLRHSRGELRSDADADAEFFETAIAYLEAAGYMHYEISNYAREGFTSLHNRGYWAGDDYLGIGPSAFSTLGMERWQNITDYRVYTDRILAGESPIQSRESLTAEAKRTERIALSLRTREGLAMEVVSDRLPTAEQLVSSGLLRRQNGKLALTRRGKALADSVAEALA
jgi:putative oxygen-independent coproporphyrinogen III oxidase